MQKIIAVALASAMLLAVACNSRNETKKDVRISELSMTETEKNEPGSFGFATDSAASQEYNGNADKEEDQDQKQKRQPVQPKATEPVAKPDWDKKIIKTASINLEIKEYTKYNTSLREKVKSFGGYIAQEEQSQSDYKIENTVTVKVPVDQFDNAVTLLTSNVEKLNEKKISSQDVTAEFVDTKSRLEAKRQVRERHIGLLKQAKNMEEILNVQSEINSIQEDMEAAAGRIQYLGHSASYSTINLTYFEVLNSSAKTDDNPSFGTKFINAFKTGGSGVMDLLVGLVTIWPLFLLAFIGLVIYRRTRTAKVKV
ncbi:MAG: DUF4349 domain-containing protein [Chitinophagales bacterium]|nr:DUF4349 domain-containing protein [Chitinophagales bacterium]